MSLHFPKALYGRFPALPMGDSQATSHAFMVGREMGRGPGGSSHPVLLLFQAPTMHCALAAQRGTCQLPSSTAAPSCAFRSLCALARVEGGGGGRAVHSHHRRSEPLSARPPRLWIDSDRCSQSHSWSAAEPGYKPEHLAQSPGFHRTVSVSEGRMDLRLTGALGLVAGDWALVCPL